MPVTEFRAAVVVGAGSVSFEMIRYLTERLPAMVCPQWVYTRVQPIAVDDLLAYLVAALETPESAGRVVEVGGADVLTYGEMMLGYARVRGLRRMLVPVPVLTPLLSSYWVHLVTPIPSTMARPLIEGLRSETVVRDSIGRAGSSRRSSRSATTIAVRRASTSLEAGGVETAWSDALASTQADGAPKVLTTQDGMILERRQELVHAPAGARLRHVSRGSAASAATWCGTGPGDCAGRCRPPGRRRRPAPRPPRPGRAARRRRARLLARRGARERTGCCGSGPR